ncbi:hypothetical protein CJ030_MR7G008057 [Morella rubra]|uniref:Uncharacterized protein n=1 Tax=Morella rubra TaxID=262757 RepID=A0A6A1V480_9ROSI|nr:hypothetical protein CJ030_MR7G008057 [Morella rubra]
MSPYHHQVRDSCSSNTRHGCSTAQMCLNKILCTISSIPPDETPKEEPFRLSSIRDLETKGNGEKIGVGIDLNLRLGPSVGAQESESLAENGDLSACSFVGKASESGSLKAVKLSKKLRNSTKKKKTVALGRKTRSKRCRSRGKRDKSNDCLGLLVEAARLISGNFGDDESDTGEPSGEKELSGGLRKAQAAANEASRNGSKRKKNKSWRVEDWLGDLEDTSPVVRSKRGRTQVLPTRYRDSVLEPWKPLPRPQRSSTMTTTASRINRRSR